jgi:sulfate/thiosulfate-binding protein
MTRQTRLRTFAAALAIVGLNMTAPAFAADQTILNVSYDPTRELYKAYDEVIDGLKADVVTLALEGDINKIAAAGLLATDWRSKLQHNSTPYTSTIVFLVRKGNPKGILDWGDLIKDGVEVITPNPKTSGGAQWNFLAAWDWANTKFGGDEAKNIDFVTQLYKHVPVLDSGARGSTTTFVEREIGDVLLAWENEAFLAINELGPDKFDIVVPPTSIKAEPPVALVDKNVDEKGTREVAQAYLEYLYTDVGQKLIAKNFYRPSLPELADPEDLKRFPEVKLVSIDDPLFGGWKQVTPKFFADGGIFDKIYQPTQ